MSLEDQAPRRRLRSYAHPVRLRILSLLTGAELSAADVARELEITQANASYHLRVLLAAGQIEQSGEVSIRGGRAKLYRHPWQELTGAPSVLAGSEDQLGRRTHSPVASEMFVQAMIIELTRRSGSIDPEPPRSFTDAELWVTPAAWRQVTQRVFAASMYLHAHARAPRTPGTVRVNMSAALFGMSQADQ